MVRPTFAHVDLDAVRANYRAVLSYVGGGAGGPEVIAVVKANGYGHGAVPVARALETAGAGVLACADIEEGVELRRGGVRASILVFGALSVSDLDGVFTHGLTPTISSPFAARALRDAATRRGSRVVCHLKIDTGMNRLGFRYDNLAQTVPEVVDGPGLEIDAVYTHFATAEDQGHPLFDVQRARFDEAVRCLAELGLRPRLRHAANSAALLRERACWYEAVRPGLLLYGVAPQGYAGALPLTPVMSLRSRVVAVKGMRAGETAGYGARSPVTRPTTIAVVPAGYADGVVLLGTQAGVSIDAGEVAAAIGTVPHEILCRTGSRIIRTYDRAARRESSPDRRVAAEVSPGEQ